MGQHKCEQSHVSHVELAHEARELLRSIAALGTHRRTALTLRAAGYSYREIQQLLGVTYTWVTATSARGARRSGAPTAQWRRRWRPRYGGRLTATPLERACHS
jgi:DNA-directed RNA polymerase specialized sigma24 family protein